MPRERAAQDGYVGTGHLLLALLDSPEGHAARALQQFAIDRERLRTLLN